MDLSGLTETLADVHIATIAWFAVALTVARIFLIKVGGVSVRVIVEILEAALIAGVLVFMVIQPFFVKAFYIPSGSMLPTLIKDDHILVDKFSYRVGRPHDGDVIVFNAPPQALEQAGENSTPGDQIDYIKRLIGVPGDTIQVVGGKITIGTNVYHHSDVRPHFGLSEMDASSKDEQHLKFVTDGVEVYDGHKWTKYSAQEVAQRLNGSANAPIQIQPGYVIRNGQKLAEPYIAEDPDYDLKLAANGDVVMVDPEEDGSLKINGQEPSPDQAIDFRNTPAGKVAPNEVIVMGDNRNDSNDSSRWGPLDMDRLVGHAVFIFFPFDRIHPIR